VRLGRALQPLRPRLPAAFAAPREDRAEDFPAELFLPAGRPDADCLAALFRAPFAPPLREPFATPLPPPLDAEDFVAREAALVALPAARLADFDARRATLPADFEA